MSVEFDRATIPCNVCGAAVTELRRGRCWGCYTQWAASRPVGKGACCSICTEKRRNQLRLIELRGSSLPFCHGCAARVIALPQVPATLGEIRKLLRRERRDADRRNDKLDRRVFPRERRVGERREPSRPRGDTGPEIWFDDIEDLIIEVQDVDLEPVEQTLVRECPAPPPGAVAAGKATARNS